MAPSQICCLYYDSTKKFQKMSNSLQKSKAKELTHNKPQSNQVHPWKQIYLKNIFPNIIHDYGIVRNVPGTQPTHPPDFPGFLFHFKASCSVLGGTPEVPLHFAASLFPHRPGFNKFWVVVFLKNLQHWDSVEELKKKSHSPPHSLDYLHKIQGIRGLVSSTIFFVKLQARCSIL